MDFDYWYDYGYDYGSADLSVDGLFGGLLGGFGSLFDGLFYDDYSYYDYGFDYDDYGYDDVISVGSADSPDDYSLADSIFGLFGGLTSYDDTLSVDGSSGLLGLLDGFDSLLGGLFYDDYSYYDYGYDYDDYGYDDVISVGSSDLLNGLSDISGLESILGLLDGSGLSLSTDGSTIDTNSLLTSILGMLDDSGAVLSVDGGDADLSSLLSPILGLLGDSGSSDGIDLSSVLGLLGGSGISDGGSDLSSILGLLEGSGISDNDIDLSSILSLLGGSGTTISTDTSSALSGIDLSAILGLLGGSGTTISTDSLSGISGLLGNLASIYSGAANLSNGNATWDDLSFLDNLSGILPNTGSDDGTTGTSNSFDLSSILGLLSGSSTTVSTDSNTTTTTANGIDLSSILGLLGSSGTTISTDSSKTTTSTATGIDLSSILGLLGGSGTTISTDTSSALSGIELSSILGLLGGSGSTISTDSLSGISGLLGNLASIYSGTANLSNGNATWDDLSFLDNLSGVLPSSGSSDDSTGTSTSFDLSSILGLLGGSGTTISTDTGSTSASTGIDLSSILGLLGGSGTTISTDTGSTSASTGIDLSSILGLLGGSGTTISTDNSTTSALNGIDLSSILSLLGGSDTAGIDLTSILGLLGSSGSTLSVDSENADLASLQDFLSGLINSNAQLKVDITLTTDEGSSSLQYEGLLSHFITTVTADVGSLVTTTTFAPEMTVHGVTLPASDLLTEVGQAIESALQTVSVLSWGDETEAAAQGYWVEIARGDLFDDAIRLFTAGTSLDVDGSAGAFSCRAALKDGEFSTDAAEWTADTSAPRQIVSNANGLADVFFASPAEGDVWESNFLASNALTGETADIEGKNRIRDTFSGSASDANILYLTDTANGDALFMDDVYSEFGKGARLSLIREIRSGAGADIIDMTSDRYNAELAGMTVRGGSGDDVLWGAKGGNMLFGDDGDDRITGGSGADIIAGGSGNDVLNGGGGADLFAFGENWGNDVVTQINGGSISLWFAENVLRITAVELDGDVLFRNAAGTSSVTVKNAVLDDLELHFGSDQSVCFTGLTAAGAFLGSTAESVFENQDARMQGILASL